MEPVCIRRTVPVCGFGVGGGGNEAIMDSLMIVLVSATIKYIMFKIGRIFVGILVIEH